MRGHQERTGPLFSYISSEVRIPPTYPLRQVWRLADQALDRQPPLLPALPGEWSALDHTGQAADAQGDLWHSLAVSHEVV